MNVPQWLCPVSLPETLKSRTPRTVKIADFYGRDEDDYLSLEGDPLKRARKGEIPLPSTEYRACYDAVPIYPESITSREAGKLAKVTASRVCTVLGLLADRKVPLVHRVRQADTDLRWTRER